MTVQERIMQEIGLAAVDIARKNIRSETLRRAIRFEYFSFRRGRLYIPHYWAIYQHDGRGGVYPVKKKFLVWFRDARNDPRLAGGYPVRLSDVRRLTKAEFEAGVAKNRELDPTGKTMPYMIIATYSPPGAGGKVYPFFDTMDPPIRSEVERIIRREIAFEYEGIAVGEKSTATARI